MLPSDLQDKVFEMGKAGDLKYHKVRDAIVGIMNNRARVLEPTPMDIGQVGGPVRESRGQLRLGWRRRTVHFRCGCSWEGHVRRLSSLRGDLAISPESAQHQRAKARGRERRVVKAAWISGSRAKVSLSREDGVGMGSLGLPITDLGRATRGKVMVRDIRGSVGCVGKLVTRRQSAAERGVEAVALGLVEEEEVVADVGGVWTIASVEKGRTKAKGWRRPTKKEAALRRRSTEVAFVRTNKFGVLEVDSKFRRRCTSCMWRK